MGKPTGHLCPKDGDTTSGDTFGICDKPEPGPAPEVACRGHRDITPGGDEGGPKHNDDTGNLWPDGPRSVTPSQRHLQASVWMLVFLTLVVKLFYIFHVGVVLEISMC